MTETSQRPGSDAARARQHRVAGLSGEDLQRYRWTAMGVVLVGTLMVILDVTIVNVALPQIGKALHSPQRVDWIVTVYLLAVGVVQPVTGWLADRFGKRRVFITSLALFTAGSALCAIAPTLPALVAFRILQGLGGGSMVPVSQATIYELFPADERGRAMGFWGIAAMAGPAIGPVLGGFIVSVADWRWLFVVNVPVGIVGFVLAVRLLRDTGYRNREPLDWPGLVLAAAGSALVLFALSEATTWGWLSGAFLGMVALGLVLLVAFVLRSLRVRSPLVQVRIFGVRVFSQTILVVCLLTLAQYGRITFIPIELEGLHRLSAFHTGLLLVPSAACAAVMMPIGGRLTDRVGAKVPVITGLVLVVASTALLGTLSLDTPMWMVAVYIGVGGLGNGLATMPNTVVGMNSLPNRYLSQATAVRSLTRRVAAAFGIAVLSSIVVSQIGALSLAGGGRHVDPQAAQTAYDMIFWIAAAGAALAGVLALRLPGREEALRLQRERAEDDSAMVDR